MLENRFGFGFVFGKNVRITTEQVNGDDVCRVDVPQATDQMWSTLTDTEELFVRRNN